MAATGGAETSWRNPIRRFAGSSTRRDVQFFTSPLAVAQIRIRSSGPERSA